MKKLILSAAVIAASGAYVAYADHGGISALALNASAAGAPLAAYVAPVTPQAAPAVAAPPAAPSLPKPAAKLAATAPPAPGAAAAGAAGDPDSIGSIIADAVPAPKPAQPSPPIPATPALFTLAAPAAPSRPAPRPIADAVIPLPLPRPLDAPQPDASVLPTRQAAAAISVAQARGVYRDGTYKGVSANAYYGRVRVEAVVRGGRLTSIKILDYPSDRRRSRYIASYSLPVLERESISAQSANIDVVSGATLTSRAFRRSLDSALSAARAGGSNA